ncbi:MAG TPA: hypothetical protein VMV33_17120 [Rhodocyclaceae bacterium]|nr:hypothetical protein [Rhodocyclaceae bacterium]
MAQPQDTSLVQFAAQAYRARSSSVAAMRCVNMFVERMPPDAKTPVPVYQVPGLELFSRFGRGGITGMIGMAGILYAVSGNQLFSVNADGLGTLLGTTNLSNRLSLATNDSQLVMVDGYVGWIYQPGGLNQVAAALAPQGATSLTLNVTGVLVSGQSIEVMLDSGATFVTTISGTPTPVHGEAGRYVVTLTDALPSVVSVGGVAKVPTVVLGQIKQPGFRPAATVIYFDTYFIFEARHTNSFFLSGIGDGTQYDPLDFASAQANPDYILAVVNYHEQLLLMGGSTIEVWYDSGAALFPFQRFDGAFVQRGLAAALAVCQEDNTVLWLGDDVVFYRLDGYRPQRVSTFAMETEWKTYPTVSDAYCFVVTVDGHKFVFLNFPSGKRTWCYDIASGAEEPLWHERESWGSPWV